MPVVVSSPDVAAPSGHFSPCLLIDPGKQWLFLSGQVAVALDGTIPERIEAQTRLVWQNIKHLLAAAHMSVGDIVKVTSYLISADHLAGFNVARAGILGEHKPASTLLVVSGLARPQFLVEIEVIAAK
jgi:enamine deaminase RidA (YjgF/YER057c/UK114 family)